jgi:allophanate hydrolase subunit 2
VPSDGNPVVLMADHATLGGYPVAGCVISADLGELARCKPGETVVLEPVTLEEAATARRALRRALDDAVVGRYPTAAG